MANINSMGEFVKDYLSVLEGGKKKMKKNIDVRALKAQIGKAGFLAPLLVPGAELADQTVQNLLQDETKFEQFHKRHTKSWGAHDYWVVYFEALPQNAKNAKTPMGFGYDLRKWVESGDVTPAWHLYVYDTPNIKAIAQKCTAKGLTPNPICPVYPTRKSDTLWIPLPQEAVKGVTDPTKLANEVGTIIQAILP